MTDIAAAEQARSRAYRWGEGGIAGISDHGDNGAGLGASHQTGWSGLVACLFQMYGALDPVKAGKRGFHSAVPH